MEIGMELITKERQEQIKKHGYSKAHDRRINGNGELARAALYCLGRSEWPVGWSTLFKDKIDKKSQIGKLAVAGAFYMAEQDRLGLSHYYATEIRNIAREIETLVDSTEKSNG